MCEGQRTALWRQCFHVGTRDEIKLRPSPLGHLEGPLLHLPSPCLPLQTDLLRSLFPCSFSEDLKPIFIPEDEQSMHVCSI